MRGRPWTASDRTGGAIDLVFDRPHDLQKSIAAYNHSSNAADHEDRQGPRGYVLANSSSGEAGRTAAVVDIDSTEGEPGPVLHVPSDDTRIHIGRPENGPTKEDIERTKVDDLGAAVVAALRAEPMFTYQLTRSIRA